MKEHRMTDNLLELIRLCYHNGETADARNLLLGVLRADPRNAVAWELMALLTDDPVKRADCYRQILKIDPQNRVAKDGLEELLGERARTASPDVQQVVTLLREVGMAALDKETVDHFKAMGVNISVVDEYVTISSGSREAKVYLGSLPSSQTHLYPDDIVRRAGQPLPLSERKECPTCRATITRSATRCPWCSADIG